MRKIRTWALAHGRRHSTPTMQIAHDIFIGGPRRSYHRSFGACADFPRISDIYLLAAASSQWQHIVHIRCKRRSELSTPTTVSLFGTRTGVIASA